MQRRVDLASALIHLPPVVFLDEPTEGLDPLMQRAFYTILDELKAEGRTIFFSSHVLSEVERVCDRVAIVRRGRLVALQEVASLLEHRKRNVEIRAADGDIPVLDGVAGVSALKRTADGRLTCQLEGDVGPFLAAIAGHRISDLTIEPAHLEEAFLELYEDAEPDGGAAVASAPAATAEVAR
jgi:ABC-2 type transport system ATP-binding protein